MKPRGVFALESIEFQNGQLFKDLSARIKGLHGLNRRMLEEDYFNSEEIKGLANFIRERTGLDLYFAEGGPAMHISFISQNHIFLQDFKWYFSQEDPEWHIDPHLHARRVMKKLDTKVLKGHVDLVSGRVHGCFEHVTLGFFMPRDWLESDKYATAEECAAVMLHEIGHAFTFFEYLDRTATTNQVLAAMVRTLDMTLGSPEREAIIAAGADLIRMDEEQRKKVLAARTDKEIALIVLDSAIERSRSELDCNVYDPTSCEQLADQFAVRHGAGKHLALALHKLMGGGSSTLGYLFARAMELFILLLATIFTLGLFLLMIAFGSYSAGSYDNPYERFQRMLLQNRERLKNRNIGKAEKQALIEDNQVIEGIMKQYPEGELGIIGGLAYIINSNWRRGYRYEKMQIELEKLAGNKLFEQAAKLATLGKA